MADSGSKQPVRLLLMIVCFALLGVWFGATVGSALKKSGSPSALRLWHLAAFPVVTFLVIAWHELGHVTGGWLSGFRLQLFAVGPLKIERVFDRLNVGWNTSLHLWGGIAATSPKHGVPQDTSFMRRALVRIVAGGPFFSIVGAAFMAATLLLLDWRSPGGILAGMAGVMSLLVGLATLTPIAAGGFHSDGARLLQLLRGGDAADRWAHLSILAGLSQTTRPREWPAELVLACCVQGGSGYDSVSGAWLRAVYHEDRGELAEARVWITEALGMEEDWPKPARAILHASAAYIHAQLSDIEGARRQLSAADGAGFHAKEQILLAESAVLLAEERWAEAAAAAAQGLRQIPPEARGTDAATREAFARIAEKAATSGKHHAARPE